jgi:hypothetical protein
MASSWLTIRRRLAVAWHRRGFPFEACQRRRGCLFIHVPKVAGTAVLEALGKRGGGRHHLPWYVYRAADPVFFDRAFKFAFVRNPWDRVHSAWAYLSHGGNRTSDMPLAALVESFGTFDRFVTEGLGTGILRNHPLFLPQAEFVLGFDGHPVVDFLGRYENLAADFRTVAERLGLDPALPRRNATEPSPHGRAPGALSGRSCTILRALYAQDFERLHYPTDEP